MGNTTHTSTEQPEALLPCPFCGGRAEFDEHDAECYFTKLRAMRQSKDESDMGPMLELITAWNRRTPASQAQRAPLSEEQFIKRYRSWYQTASCETTFEQIFEQGFRDAERAHGITQEQG